MIRNTLVALLVVAIAGFLLMRACVTKVGVTEVGVRIVNYDLPGMSKGIEPRDFGPGWGWDFGPLHTWVVYDQTVQTLEMSDTRGPAERGKRRADAVRPLTKDGYAITVDVTVKYRIMAGKAHKLLERHGPNPEEFHAQVKRMAEGTVRDIFGDLTAEDFYNPKIRRERAEEAKRQLGRGLADSFIEVIDVLVRDVTFPPSYEERILAKKIADQEVEVNRSKKAATAARLSAEKIVAETEAEVGKIEKQREAEKARRAALNEKEIAKILADAKAYATEVHARAELLMTQKIAAGEQLRKLAEAEGTKKKNQALGGPGGRAERERCGEKGRDSESQCVHDPRSSVSSTSFEK